MKNLIEPILNPLDEPMIKFYNEALRLSKSLSSSVSFAEVGTRSGDASILLLKAIYDSGIRRWLFTIDPYGNKPYGHGEKEVTHFDYGEHHYRNAMYSLSKYAWEADLLHYHYRMRSQEFAWIAENVEFWYEGNKMDFQYGFVYLDGEHTTKAIKTELDYFLPRLVSGGMIVIDDISIIKQDSIPLFGIEGDIIWDKLWYTKP